jgi:hypothetical protein
MSWIRSQDGMTLLEPKAIWMIVDPIDKSATIGAEAGTDCHFSLGTFKTEEDGNFELGRIDEWIDAGGSGVYQVSQP